jgi:hypothetical protein
VIIHSHSVNRYQKESGINFGKLKTKIMIYFIIGLVGTFLWVIYEFWRAPLMDTRDGKWITIRPTKELKHLFKKTKK